MQCIGHQQVRGFDDPERYGYRNRIQNYYRVATVSEVTAQRNGLAPRNESASNRVIIRSLGTWNVSAE